jgi:hypothetical protein
MKRARKSKDWREFVHKAAGKDFEIITRIGDPVILHKKDAPFSPETVWWGFLGRKGGKWSKKQVLGMQILRDLGQKTFKYTPES